jgi:two-component system, sensor histidine kinase and response regulator
MNHSASFASTVLIVDDEPHNLTVLDGLLTQYGYSVQAANDGKTAIEMAKNHHPDIVLLDIMMPEMNGFEVCEQLKTDSYTREIPVIFISALTNVNDVVHAFQAGAVDYITKPFQFAEVLARVENHLTIIQQKYQLLEQSNQIESMRKREQRRFAQINQMREQFVQAATHDLKNPLAIIMGSADIMARFDEVRGNRLLRDCVQSILESSKAMTDLITGMLDLLRMQSSLDLNFQPVNYTRFVESQIQKHQSAALARGINLTFASALTDFYVNIDEKLIGRVVDNLVTNAIQYSHENTKIDVILSEEEKDIVLQVRDEGFGMSADDLQKLFTPFFRAKKMDGERVIEGAGLGLAIVKEILEQHRGRIDVYSKVGDGSVFRVYLPKHIQHELKMADE